MAEKHLVTPSLLVVDDEAVVGQSCARIFEGLGYNVETTTNPLRGIELASKNDYSAILLDFKMPDMDGLEFLEQMREKNLNVPVIMITGYSSVQNAAAAMRLGAIDYIPKPFTPDEIRGAVERLIKPGQATETATGPLPKGVSAVPVLAPDTSTQLGPWQARDEETWFLGNAWAQIGIDSSLRLGVFLAREEAQSVEHLRLPEPGERVYQGLPMAGVTLTGQLERPIPAAFSGEVLELNPELTREPRSTLVDPCQSGWLVRIRPSHLEEERVRTSPRRLLLINFNEVTARDERNQLTRLGLKVLPASTAESALRLLREEQPKVALLDADSLGENGTELVGRLNALARELKIIVLQTASDPRAVGYREKKIFYLAVEPFADHEILTLLQDAFRTAPMAERPTPPSAARWIRRIRITNRKGERVALLTSGGHVPEGQGLGQCLVQAVLEANFPVRVTLGTEPVSALEIRKEAHECDRIVVLQPDKGDFLPAHLRHNPIEQFQSTLGEVAPKVTVLSVQPENQSAVLSFEPSTTDALARHLLHEMVGV